MTKRNNKKLAEIEESLKNDKVTLKTLKSLLIEEAHRNYNTRALAIRISVANKFQEALANGATKAELGRWWGTKNFNTIQDLLALAEPIEEPAQEAVAVDLPSLENRGHGYVAVDGVVFKVGNTTPISSNAGDEFWSRPEIAQHSDVVRKFIETGELP